MNEITARTINIIPGSSETTAERRLRTSLILAYMTTWADEPGPPRPEQVAYAQRLIETQRDGVHPIRTRLFELELLRAGALS